MNQISSPGWMHETSALTWCTGKNQRDGMEREVGGGIGMGNTCKPMAVSFQCMTKSTTIKKKNLWPSTFIAVIKCFSESLCSQDTGWWFCCKLVSYSEKAMATHSSVLAWRIPGTGEPGGLPSMDLHRVGHHWSDLAAAAAAVYYYWKQNTKLF